MKTMTHDSQRGAALITVLFLFIIAALIAMGLLSRQRLDVERTGTMLAQAQGYHYAYAAEELARQVLLADATLMPGLDYPGQRWAHLNQGVPIDNGTMVFRLEDMQARININALIDSEAEKDRFKELIRRLQMREEVCMLIFTALGTKDSPHLMADSSELRDIEGLTTEEIRALLPFVTAFPERAAMLNVNTASETVLKSYVPDEQAYERFMKAFAKKGYLSEAELNGIGMNTKGMGVASRYFRLTSEVTMGGHRVVLGSNLVRNKDVTGTVRVRVVNRDNNGRW